MAVVWILITGIAYFLAAKIAMLFAIPPGYATAIWPAAGIALAALLKFGYRLWPGVLLGSFLANLTVPGSASLTALQFTDLILPFAIASGATLQAVIGRWLAQRSFDNEFELIEVRSILSFVLLVGFVGCLTSSLIGVSSLVATGAVAINDAPFNWLNWWVGDSLGVILVTPLVYAAFGAPEANWGFRRLIMGAPLLAAATLRAGSGSSATAVVRALLLRGATSGTSKDASSPDSEEEV